MPAVLGSIADIDARYRHVYLSPHLDDAILSCGATLAQRAREPARVLVVTACAGAPPADVALGRFGQQLHTEWGLSPAEVSAARRREDQAAAARVGADVLWLDFLDAIYRAPQAYAGKDALFGPIAPDDPLPSQLAGALAEIAARCPDAVLHAPLGVGLHVDHCAAHAAAAALDGRVVFYYEDFPYVAQHGALAGRLEMLGGAAGWTPSVRAIDNAALADRIAAIRLYKSQIGLLFGDDEIMDRVVTEHARALAPAGGAHGERTWTPAPAAARLHQAAASR